MKEMQRRIAIEIGQRMRIRRRELGLCQKGLARKLNVHPGKISNWELGKASISAACLMTICIFLKVPVSYFYPDALLEETEGGVGKWSYTDTRRHFYTPTYRHERNGWES